MFAENIPAHVAQSPALLHEELHSGSRSQGERHTTAVFPDRQQNEHKIISNRLFSTNWPPLN